MKTTSNMDVLSTAGGSLIGYELLKTVAWGGIPWGLGELVKLVAALVIIYVTYQMYKDNPPPPTCPAV